MKTKTTAQIEALKNQTFGVEIEMYNIGRQQAAEVVAEYFYGHASGHCYYKGGMYDAWACQAPDGRVWVAESDSSIVGRNGRTRTADCAELVTPILKYEDLEGLQEIVRRLRKAGAKSNPAHSCGVHIHIGLGDHTPQTLRNLANLMSSHESLLVHAINIDRLRLNTWCKAVDPLFISELNSKKPKTMRELSDIWYVSNGCPFGRDQHYNQSRYHILNYHAVFTKGTIEFRCFQFRNRTENRRGGLHAGELKAYIQLCLALSQMAKQSRRCSPVEVQQENEKFAMRTWLVRLGFVGEEFKTAREVLLKNLDGDCAFRFNNRAQYVAAASAVAAPVAAAV